MEIDFKDEKDKNSEAYKLKCNRHEMKEKQRKNQELYEAEREKMHQHVKENDGPEEKEKMLEVAHQKIYKFYKDKDGKSLPTMLDLKKFEDVAPEGELENMQAELDLKAKEKANKKKNKGKGKGKKGKKGKEDDFMDDKTIVQQDPSVNLIQE